jgi:hypothetical protein
MSDRWVRLRLGPSADRVAWVASQAWLKTQRLWKPGFAALNPAYADRAGCVACAKRSASIKS